MNNNEQQSNEQNILDFLNDSTMVNENNGVNNNMENSNLKGKSNKKTLIAALIIVGIILIPFLLYTVMIQGNHSSIKDENNNENVVKDENDEIIYPGELRDGEQEYIFHVEDASNLPSNLKPNGYVNISASFVNENGYKASGVLFEDVRIIDVKDNNNKSIDTSKTSNIPVTIKLALTVDLCNIMNNAFGNPALEKYDLKIYLTSATVKSDEKRELSVANEYLRDLILNSSMELPSNNPLNYE